jgi:exopolysaccharide biosynthesis polyprenyl glycosylphosphotransferase
MLLYFIAMDTVLMTIVHQIIKLLLPGMYQRFMDRTRMLLVADSEFLEQAVDDVRGFADFSQDLIGLVVPDKPEIKEFKDLPVVTDIDHLTEYCKTASLDEVIIAVDDHDRDNSDKILNVMEDIAKMGMIIHYRISLPDLNGARHKILLKRGNMYTVTYANQITSMGQVVIKRVMDLTGGIVGCIIAAVLYIVFGPIIKLQSPGPVLFTQKRVGRNGRVFNMYKFRSMYVDAEEKKGELLEKNEMNGLMFKMDDDPRITPIGRFLRKTSLDEFPQFYNILRGDMSLVGTRPPTVDEFNNYSYYHKKRLSFRPGLTGMWQVSGRNEITDFDEIVRLDVDYIDNWTIMLDIKILLKTIGVVFKGK